MRYSSYEEANRFAKESEELIHRTEDMIHAYESQNDHVFDSVRQYESKSCCRRTISVLFFSIVQEKKFM